MLNTLSQFASMQLCMSATYILHCTANLSCTQSVFTALEMRGKVEWVADLRAGKVNLGGKNVNVEELGRLLA